MIGCRCEWYPSSEALSLVHRPERSYLPHIFPPAPKHLVGTKRQISQGTLIRVPILFQSSLGTTLKLMSENTVLLGSLFSLFLGVGGLVQGLVAWPSVVLTCDLVSDFPLLALQACASVGGSCLIFSSCAPLPPISSCTPLPPSPRSTLLLSHFLMSPHLSLCF